MPDTLDKPVNPNKALWEKGDFTRIAATMRESGEALVRAIGIGGGLKVLDLGFDNQLIWFGVLYTITCQIAYITPPFGYNLFLMRAMAPPEITLVDIYRSIVPFFFLMVLTIVILMIFPQIALWLPSLYQGR